MCGVSVEVFGLYCGVCVQPGSQLHLLVVLRGALTGREVGGNQVGCSHLWPGFTFLVKLFPRFTPGK